MKQQFALLLVASFFGVSCNSQDIAADKVPAVVVNALTAKVPNATGVEWEKKGALYEADLDAPDGKDITVQIDASGKLLMLKRDIVVTELPAAIQTALQSQYKDFTLDEIEAVEKEGAVLYQVELDGKGLKGLKNKKLVLNATGQEAANTAYWD
jgi:uncharacterized membrane protein YkoI